MLFTTESGQINDQIRKHKRIELEVHLWLFWPESLAFARTESNTAETWAQL